MEYLTIGLLIILIVITSKRKQYLFNPVTIFSGTWIIIVFLASFKLFDMISYRNDTIVMILLSNIGFFFGNLPSKYLGIKNSRKSTEIKESSRPIAYTYSLNKKFIVACLILAFSFIVVLTISVLRLLRGGIPYSTIRDILLGYSTDSKLVNSGFFMIFFLWVISGIVYAFIPIALIELFENKKINFWVFAGLLLAVGYTFATAGRAVVFIVIIQLIVLLKHYNYTLPRKIKRMVKRGVILLVIGLVIISYLRTSTSSDKHVNSLYSYFSISVPLLSHWTEYIEMNHISMRGGAILYGVEAIFAWIMRFAGLILPGYSNLDELVNIPQNKWITIFYDPVSRYNAFCSAIYYFYLDFGWIGVFILPILFGLVINNVFNRVNRIGDKKSLFIYLLIIQMLVLSFIKLQTSNPPYIFALIIMFLAIKRIKIPKVS